MKNHSCTPLAKKKLYLSLNSFAQEVYGEKIRVKVQKASQKLK
jgi:hypothetical protein